MLDRKNNQTNRRGSLPLMQTKVRYLVLSMLFIASAVSYGDRAILGIVGSAVSRDMGLDPIAMGYILSASAISYLMVQIPGGLLLDRFGSRWIYAGAIALWSLFTVGQGLSGLLRGQAALMTLLLVRLAFGLCSAPTVPANARITASWFPTSERGAAAAIFNSAQYFALVVFAPLVGWTAHTLSWHWPFYLLGAIGLAVAALFPFVVRSPLQHPLIGKGELDYIERGGALVNIETQNTPGAFTWRNLRQIALHRRLLGLYLFQYCIGVVVSFFVTWFPAYLVEQRGLTLAQGGALMAVPALFGLLGNVTGGFVSDALLRRTGLLTFARKLPACAGLILAMSILGCDFTSSPLVAVGIMSLAFFGKGLAAIGWTMILDTSPKELIGITGGVFNMVSNVAAVVTPIVVGHIVGAFGSFDWAFVFVFAHCLIGLSAVLMLIGPIERITIDVGRA